MARLRTLLAGGPGLILIGDLVLTEVLQGIDEEREARFVETMLGQLDQASLVGPFLAIRSAQHYRSLRRRGVTVRKTIDMLIGTFCIEHGHALLHSDRDFEPMERHLGLKVLHGPAD